MPKGIYLRKPMSEEGRAKLRNRPKRFGLSSPGWRGGRIKANGNEDYIMIYKPEHPNCDKRGYILEHRLLMEQKLGRLLTSMEVVDHINGVKNDNRIDNLRLFNTHSEHMKEEWDRGRIRKGRVIYG